MCIKKPFLALLMLLPALVGVALSCLKTEPKQEKVDYQRNLVNPEGQKLNIDDNPYWVISNEIKENVGYTFRDIYIYVKTEDFSQEKITFLASKISGENKSPSNLKISIFNDKDILLNSINFEKRLGVQNFPGSPIGKEIIKKERDKIVPSSGYLRAFYYRTRYKEYLTYSTAPQSLSLDTLVINANPLSADDLAYTKALLLDDPTPFKKISKEENLNQTLTYYTELAALYAKPNILSYLLSINPRADYLKILIMTAKSFESWDPFLGDEEIYKNASVADRTKSLLLILNKKRFGNEDLSLMLCYATKHKELVEVLLEHGSIINFRGEEGWTALMYASYYGHADTAKLLLQEGADPKIKSYDGWTAQEIAQKKGFKEIVRLLQ